MTTTRLGRPGALIELPFALRAAGLIRAWGGPARSCPPGGARRDPQLAQRRQRDAPVEHAVAVARDLVEKRAVDGRHRETGTLCMTIACGQCRECRVVPGARAFGLEAHEVDERRRR